MLGETLLVTSTSLLSPNLLSKGGIVVVMGVSVVTGLFLLKESSNFCMYSPVGSQRSESCAHTFGYSFLKRLIVRRATVFCFSVHLAQFVWSASGSIPEIRHKPLFLCQCRLNYH